MRLPWALLAIWRSLNPIYALIAISVHETVTYLDTNLA